MGSTERHILPAEFTAGGGIDCRLVIFDLDGTLIDSARGIKNSIRKTIEKLNLPAKSEEELTAFVGPPLRATFQRHFGLTEAEAEDGLHAYRRFYYQGGIYEAAVYDGIPRLLKELKEKGYVLAVGTSKPWVMAHRVLRHFGLRVYFDGVFGCYQDGRLDSKALVLQALLEHYSGAKLLAAGRRFPDSRLKPDWQPQPQQQAQTRPEQPGAGIAGSMPPEQFRAIMIGDRFYDVEGAKVWGLPAIGVTYGYGTAAELTKAGAALIVSRPGEIGAKLPLLR